MSETEKGRYRDLRTILDDRPDNAWSLEIWEVGGA
jgi:hypothetical protein